MACRRKRAGADTMRMRPILLACVALAVIGGIFAWGKYMRTDPVRAEAAMQQPAQPAAPGNNSSRGQNQAQAAPGGSNKAAVAVKVTEVTQASMPIRRRTIGWVEPIATVAVKSRIDSVIMEQHAQDGQFVEKGDLLFSLDDREIKAS